MSVVVRHGLRDVVAHGMLGRMPQGGDRKRSLRDHPGNLGLTSQGVIAIHANWPMYPWEHGWLMALVNLCCFPAGTTFTEIDGIDRVLLLSAEELAPDKAGDNLFSPERFHAAIWHEDLIVLAGLGYVNDVEAITDSVHALNWHLEALRSMEHHKGESGDESIVPGPYTEWPADGPPDLPKIYGQLPDGTLIEAPLPVNEDDEEYQFGWSNPANCVLLPNKTLAVTPAGSEACDQALANQFVVPEALRARLQPILDAGLYDTAIRETSWELETAMRRGIGTKRGQKLVERYCRYVERNAGVLSSAVKSLRGELRLTFRFVRNLSTRTRIRRVCAPWRSYSGSAAFTPR